LCLSDFSFMYIPPISSVWWNRFVNRLPPHGWSSEDQKIIAIENNEYDDDNDEDDDDNDEDDDDN